MARRITLDQWRKGLRRGFVAEFRVELARIALLGERAAKLQATRSPRARTGRLRSSIRSEVRVRPGQAEIALQAGSPSIPYARIQERGGTIVPRRARYLSIPLSRARTAAGVSRYASPRQVPGLFFLQLGSKRFLVRREGKSLQFYYLLVDSVRLKGRRYLARGVSRMRREIPHAFRRSVRGVSDGR